MPNRFARIVCKKISRRIFPVRRFKASTRAILENVEAPAQIHGRGKSSSVRAWRDGDALSIPIGPREQMVRAYAPLSQRHLDVRLFSQTTSESEYTLKIPPGSKISAMPGASTLPSPFGNFSVAIDQVPGGVRA